MRRREFVKLLTGSAVAWPLAARAQQTSEIPRFGFVYQGSQAAMALRIEAILSGLRVSGYALPLKSRLWAEQRKVTPRKLLLW
jgi:putative tryptophan/tyrosine transport system substrate-binding protein